MHGYYYTDDLGYRDARETWIGSEGKEKKRGRPPKFGFNQTMIGVSLTQLGKGLSEKYGSFPIVIANGKDKTGSDDVEKLKKEVEEKKLEAAKYKAMREAEEEKKEYERALEGGKKDLTPASVLFIDENGYITLVNLNPGEVETVGKLAGNEKRKVLGKVPMEKEEEVKITMDVKEYIDLRMGAQLALLRSEFKAGFDKISAKIDSLTPSKGETTGVEKKGDLTLKILTTLKDMGIKIGSSDATIIKELVDKGILKNPFEVIKDLQDMKLLTFGAPSTSGLSSEDIKELREISKDQFLRQYALRKLQMEEDRLKRDIELKKAKLEGIRTWISDLGAAFARATEEAVEEEKKKKEEEKKTEVWRCKTEGCNYEIKITPEMQKEGNLIECPKCHAQYIWEKGKPTK